MTTFNFNPDFYSLFAGSYEFNGRSNHGFNIGVDGNHYLTVANSVIPNLGIYILCAETNQTITITEAQFASDVAATVGGVATTFTDCLNAPGTPYIWVWSYEATTHGYYNIPGILYKIINDTTVQVVGGFYLRSTGSETVVTQNSWYSTATINNTLHALGTVRSGGLFGYSEAVIKLPLTEGININLTLGSFDAYFDWWTNFGGTDALTDFFRYYDNNKITQGLATIIPEGGSYTILMYISQGSYDYISANSSFNPLWPSITRPGVYLFGRTDSTLHDLTDQFLIDDIKTHLDGSPSSNYYDDYQSPNYFVKDGVTYLTFVRSYTQVLDLEPIGTYCRVRMYSWDGGAVSVFDDKSILFDPVADCGVSEPQRFNSYPEFIQLGFDPDTDVLYYAWYGRAGALDFDYVFGPLVEVSATPPGDTRLVFSELRNDNFSDWQSADTANHTGSDFSSYLITYYVYNDDQMLWMEAPYIYVYLQQTERNTPSLFMQPRWEWAEDSTSNKFSRIEQVYRPQIFSSLVGVSKNRVRGKGRILQLKYFSEAGKDFNLLAWGIFLDKNARY